MLTFIVVGFVFIGILIVGILAFTFLPSKTMEQVLKRVEPASRKTRSEEEQKKGDLPPA